MSLPKFWFNRFRMSHLRPGHHNLSVCNFNRFGHSSECEPCCNNLCLAGGGQQNLETRTQVWSESGEHVNNKVSNSDILGNQSNYNSTTETTGAGVKRRRPVQVCSDGSYYAIFVNSSDATYDVMTWDQCSQILICGQGMSKIIVRYRRVNEEQLSPGP